jgi:hypothetical protein
MPENQNEQVIVWISLRCENCLGRRMNLEYGVCTECGGEIAGFCGACGDYLQNIRFAQCIVHTCDADSRARGQQHRREAHERLEAKAEAERRYQADPARIQERIERRRQKNRDNIAVSVILVAVAVVMALWLA